MTTATFLPGVHLAQRADLSFGGLAAMSVTSAPGSPSAYFPVAFGARQPKLPSLEGLLKKMQDGSVSPQAAQSLADFSERAYAQQQHRSPTGRDMIQTPALRAIISPSMAKSAATLTHRCTPTFPLDVFHQDMALPSRKRSWMEATSAPMTEAVFYPSKEHATSPVSTRATKTKTTTKPTTASSSGPHRSRASKYCKIEGCERVSQRNNLCHSHGGKRLCKEDGCSSKDRGNGYCIKHGGGKICSMESCEKKARRKGLCTQHFREDDSESSERAGAI